MTETKEQTLLINKISNLLEVEHTLYIYTHKKGVRISKM